MTGQPAVVLCCFPDKSVCPAGGIVTELRKITTKNVWDVVRLDVSGEQRDYVAPNRLSIIEAFAAREEGYVALPFALYDEERPVGFVMLGYGTAGDEDEPSVAEHGYCLWRFMIDREYQGKGLGRKALDVVLAYTETMPCGNADVIWLSFEPENVRARELYRQAGFLENGEMCGDEVVMVRPLRPKTARP